MKDESKLYERQFGEPNLWYARLVHFMEMGPGRSLDGCYREVMNAERAAKGRERLHSGARCPAAWRKRAKEFDWWARAEAYDAHLRSLAWESKEEALRLVRSHSVGLVKRLLDLARGELRGPDGALVAGQDAVQMRLAIISLLNRAGVVHEGQAEEVVGETPILAFQILHKSGEGDSG